MLMYTNFCLVVLISLAGLCNGMEKCKWIKNNTGTVNMPHHKYVILEDCLYYSLSAGADKSQGQPNSLAQLPPTRNAGDVVRIVTDQVIIRQLWINEMWKEMNLNGYIAMSWNDYRMKWTPNEWRQKKSINVKNYGHLWVPDLISGRSGSAAQGNDFTVFKDITADYTGDVNAKLEYRMQALCSTDYRDFPKDKITCNFYLHSNLFGQLIVFDMKNIKIEFDPFHHQSNWEVVNMEAKSFRNDDNEPILAVTLSVYRKSETLRIELTVPMIISAIVMLVAPLFGQMKYQVWAKLFALLLQFICFQFLVTKTPQLGFGGNTPKIYVFYEFTIAATIISLLITLICSSIGRMKRSLPPPHGLNLFTSMLNGYLCCYEAESCPENPADKSENHIFEWKQVFSAINNSLSVLLVIAYIIGTLVLCN